MGLSVNNILSGKAMLPKLIQNGIALNVATLSAHAKIVANKGLTDTTRMKIQAIMCLKILPYYADDAICNVMDASQGSDIRFTLIDNHHSLAAFVEETTNRSAKADAVLVICIGVEQEKNGTRQY